MQLELNFDGHINVFGIFSIVLLLCAYLDIVVARYLSTYAIQVILVHGSVIKKHCTV